MHLRHGLSQDRVAPIGRNIHQRDQNEGAFVQARMWQDQLLRGKAHLFSGPEPRPMAVAGKIGADLITDRQQIQVEHARPPTLRTRTSGPRLDVVQDLENRFGGHIALTCDRSVHKIGTGARWEAWGLIHTTFTHNPT